MCAPDIDIDIDMVVGNHLKSPKKSAVVEDIDEAYRFSSGQFPELQHAAGYWVLQSSARLFEPDDVDKVAPEAPRLETRGAERFDARVQGAHSGE